MNQHAVGNSMGGVDLASDQPRMEAVSVQRLKHLQEAELQWVRSRRRMIPVTFVVIATFAIALWCTGYPRWRAIALLLIAIALGGMVFVVTHSRRATLPMTFAMLGAFVLLTFAMAITGGTHSPFLVVALAQPTLFMQGGRSYQALISLGIVAGGVIVMALFAPYMGPVVPDPLFTFFTAIFLITALVIVTDHVTTLSRALDASMRELLWARDQVAREALARAREIELMSSRLSHELKNPLGAIKALVQLSSRSTSEVEVRERLDVVESEVERMSAILQDYLTFSRPLESPHFESRALAPIVDDVLSVLEARAQAAGVHLLRKGRVEAQVDERRMKEALVNLVANAIEASSAGGSVEVVLSEHDDKAVVSVCDKGRGMSAGVLARLGTPFFTTREQGHGLGVLIARSVFTQHGGTLLYSSSLGKGTTAIGTLPVRR